MNAFGRWPIVPFGTVVEDTQYGTSAKANGDRSGIPILRMGNISYDGSFDLTDMKHIGLVGHETDRYRVRKGDLLFNRTNSPDLVGKMGVWPCDEAFAFAGYLIRIRVKPPLADPRFVAAWFNTARMKELLRARAKPSNNMSNINATEVLTFPIVLPPLQAQRRIVELLERAAASRTKRRAALALLDTLGQSIFLDLFGDEADRWPMRPVSDYVAKFEGGKSFQADADNEARSAYRVLKISAVTSMEFVPSESKPVPDGYQPEREHIVRPGDLLFSRANTADLVGAVAHVEAAPPNLLLPDKLWRFVWAEPRLVDPHFVWALFQSGPVRREIARRATGTSGSMKNISQEKLMGIKTIVPPLPLQKEFARRLVSINGLKGAYRASLAQLDGLFASLQHRAFRGEL